MAETEVEPVIGSKFRIHGIRINTQFVQELAIGMVIVHVAEDKFSKFMKLLDQSIRLFIESAETCREIRRPIDIGKGRHCKYR